MNADNGRPEGNDMTPADEVVAYVKSICRSAGVISLFTSSHNLVHLSHTIALGPAVVCIHVSTTLSCRNCNIRVASCGCMTG